MRALVLGAGGFIGSHMVKRLKSEGYWVRGVDLKYPEYGETFADEFVIGDLRSTDFVNSILEPDSRFDEVYQYAADMGVRVLCLQVITMLKLCTIRPLLI